MLLFIWPGASASDPVTLRGRARVGLPTRFLLLGMHISALLFLCPPLVVCKSSQDIFVAARSSEGTAGSHAVGDEEGWDKNYVFRPSPAFWKPLAGFPAAAFPPYDLGYHPEAPYRIVFASCNRQPEGKSSLDTKHDLEGRRVWSYISRRKPRAFLWMGDNVYADHMQLPTASDSRNFLWKLSEGKKPIPPAGLRAAYKSQLATKEYTDFVAEVPAIAGTWDDHDMGEDNANKMYLYKEESKQAMLDFLGVNVSAAIRALEWRGVYSSHHLRFGEDLHVKVIFLDLRFERDSWWLMDVGDMLGEQQWAWLQQELQLSTADVNLVVSSLQTFANHRLVTETWSHFPWARERLFALLAGSGAKTPILLSGDTHYAEFAAIHCQRLPDAWCLDEQQAGLGVAASYGRAVEEPTPHQRLQRQADAEAAGSMMQQQPHEGLAKSSSACDPSDQCCSSLTNRSALFWWIPRHLPFFLLALFRVATKPDVFVPRQQWRRPLAPAYSGAFPPPPVPQDTQQQQTLPVADQSSTYLFDLTSSGLGHGVPESMCRLASAVIELAVHFLTEAPYASTLNADLSGPRLLYTERNFGELEFVENPVQLLLFPPAAGRSAEEERDIIEKLPRVDAVSKVQLERVREKASILKELQKKLDRTRPVEAARLHTKSITEDFRSRLQAFKEQRQELVKQLSASPVRQLGVIQKLNALTRAFEKYAHSVLGGNYHFFKRLLQLHSSLLVMHACEDEAGRDVGGNWPRRTLMLYGSCSLLAPWGSISPRKVPRSLGDKILWWLFDWGFGLTASREARNRALPIADAATLRLSAAVDKLTHASASARAADIFAAVSERQRHASVLASSRLRGASGFRWAKRAQPPASWRRTRLRKAFAAASDGLLREACVQLQSSRRQYQLDEMQQLFHRGVASQPADAFAFAELDASLKTVCSLVATPPKPLGLSATSTYPAVHDFGAAIADGAARAVAGSWIIVELLETKAWILSRTFDVVTGRLAKEKLLSTFASEQRHRERSVGQWACQGWKGPTESRMYRNHLYILVATLLFLSCLALILFLTIRGVGRATLCIWARSGHLRCLTRHFRLRCPRRATSQKEPAETPPTGQLPMARIAAVGGAAVAVGVGAALLYSPDKVQARVW
ncbi:hypothetical protein Efla_006814 [Eimeria flavescens]